MAMGNYRGGEQGGGREGSGAGAGAGVDFIGPVLGQMFYRKHIYY